MLVIATPATAGHAREEFEGTAVHATEGFHLLVEGEIDEESARPGQDHGKDGERPLGAANAEVAEAAPVHLGLLASIGFNANQILGWFGRGSVNPSERPGEPTLGLSLCRHCQAFIYDAYRTAATTPPPMDRTQWP